MAAPRALTAQQIAQIAYQAGFRGQGLQNIVAIALAESGGDPAAYNPETAAGTAPGMGSVGLTQVYQTAHPQYGRSALEDPLTNMRAAYEISNGGTNFAPWSTWQNGAAQKNLGQAQQAVASLSGGLTMAGNQPADASATPTVEDIKNQAINGDATPTTSSASTTPGTVVPSSGLDFLSGGGKQLVKQADGTYVIVDKNAGTVTPVDGLSATQTYHVSPYDFSVLVNQLATMHGGQSGQVDLGGGLTRYTYKDGTSVDVRQNGDSVDVLGGGTALQPPKPGGGARQPVATSQLDPVVDPNTGAIIGLRDPNTGKVTAVKQMPKPVQFPDGSLRSYNSDTGQWETVAAANPAEQALKQAQANLTAAEAAKAQQSLRPVAQTAIEQGFQTIQQIQQMLANGEITKPEADNLAQMVHENIQKTLTGTTLYEQQQQAKQNAYNNALLGKDILNQRVASGTTMADSILNAAKGTILNPPGGGSWGIDPFALAKGFVNDLGGGQQTGNLATSLLQGLQGGGPSMLQQNAAPNPFMSGLKNGLANLGQQNQQPGGANQPLDFEGQQVQTPPAGVQGVTTAGQQAGIPTIPTVAQQAGITPNPTVMDLINRARPEMAALGWNG